MKLQREDIHPLQDTCPYLSIAPESARIPLPPIRVFRSRRRCSASLQQLFDNFHTVEAVNVHSAANGSIRFQKFLFLLILTTDG